MATDAREVSPEPSLLTDSSGRSRCWWCGSDPAYIEYHDNEWGRPTHSEVALFEKLCLEGFQAGLSWLTILRKRPAFRQAFAGFDPQRIAGFDNRDVERLLSNTEIVRHRGKIEAVIANARAYRQLVDAEGPLDRFVWSFAPMAPSAPDQRDDIPTTTTESQAMARELKGRGWRFVGPTTCYAFMQSMGLVNDHLAGCSFRGG